MTPEEAALEFIRANLRPSKTTIRWWRPASELKSPPYGIWWRRPDGGVVYHTENYVATRLARMRATRGAWFCYETIRYSVMAPFDGDAAC